MPLSKTNEWNFVIEREKGGVFQKKKVSKVRGARRMRKAGVEAVAAELESEAARTSMENFIWRWLQ